MEPIAKRLRQSAESALDGVKKHKKRATTATNDDVARRIRELEAELEGSGSGSSDSDSDEDDEDDDKAVNDPPQGAGVLSLSTLAQDRVEGLPAHLLPKASSSASAGELKKRKRHPRAESPETTTPTPLLDAIQWPKRAPFACKPCGFIGNDLADFQAHRASAEHAARQENVSGVLMCKLCDKAFTSRSQLNEHRAGKWHQQRAQQRTARHVVKVCYDFIRGHCAHGDQCRFEHTETKAMKRGRALDKTKRRLCDEFKRTGRCQFGDRCLFSHSYA